MEYEVLLLLLVVGKDGWKQRIQIVIVVVVVVVVVDDSPMIQGMVVPATVYQPTHLDEDYYSN